MKFYDFLQSIDKKVVVCVYYVEPNDYSFKPCSRYFTQVCEDWLDTDWNSVALAREIATYNKIKKNFYEVYLKKYEGE